MPVRLTYMRTAAIMLTPRKLSGSLRSAANHKAKPGQSADPVLLAAVRGGDLTRGNTRKGTEGRRAVDRAVYLKRIAGLRPGETIAEAAGHDKPQVRSGRSITALIAGRPGLATVEAPTRGEASRIARWNNLVGKLASGAVTPAQFERRVSGWKPVAGQNLESDPGRVLAEIEALRASDTAIFQYSSGRAA
jgi:hypothetical protein